MKVFIKCLLTLFFLTVVGCGTESEKGIRDSRENFMKELRRALETNEIPYRVDDEGFIRYPTKYEVEVEAITEEIDKSIASEVGTRFDDDIATENLRKILEERGITFRTELRGDGKWTFWRPDDDQQKNEIEMEVVSRTFEQRAKNRKKSGEN